MDIRFPHLKLVSLLTNGDCGDSLEASLSGTWSGGTWVTGLSVVSPNTLDKAQVGPSVTYNIVNVGTTKEVSDMIS